MSSARKELILREVYSNHGNRSEGVNPSYHSLSVHEETRCHIHFPDSNRSLHTDKSNQVSITGQEKGVELARKRIRVRGREGGREVCNIFINPLGAASSCGNVHTTITRSY